jgi:hypothetical protein
MSECQGTGGEGRHTACGCMWEKAKAEGYDAAIRDVVAWLYGTAGAYGEHDIADAIEHGQARPKEKRET